MLVTHFLAK